MELAEEQPAPQIVAVQKKESNQRKTSEIWQQGRTSFGPLTSSRSLIWRPNVELAEEQPVPQIAAVQKKESRQRKKLPLKKTGGQLLAIGSMQAAAAADSL